MKKLLAFLLCLALSLALLTLSLAEDRFSIRGGVTFGMSPEEIIEIEKANGLQPREVSGGGYLYESGRDLQLYYGAKGNPLNANLGLLKIMRFEYDFTSAGRKMYQLVYVLEEKGAYSYLADALSAKYGPSDESIALSTAQYEYIGDDSHLNHGRWSVPDADGTVVIDLWDNQYGICFLAYMTVPQSEDEQSSLDFGL